MFKIHDDKVYFVAETPDINKVIEIFLPKDDRKSTARIILSILLTIFFSKTMLMMRWMSFIEFSRQASIGSLMATKRWMMPFTNVVGLS